MKGETCKYPYKAEPPCDFNPCTHEGCDAEDTRIRDVVTDISIHAPMKGATFKILPIFRTSSDFNPRTHEGCDMSAMTVLPADAGFQSTHP